MKFFVENCNNIIMILTFDIIFQRNTKKYIAPNYQLNYYNVRNNAWEFLIKNNIQSYPLNLKNIADNNNWTIMSYKELCNLYKLNYNKILSKYPDGFTILTNNNEYIICYNENNIKQRNRFTICHEIGHIILHSVYKNERLEKEANMFASRILMPMLLIKELSINNAEELSKLCDVSIEASNFRLKRFEEIKIKEKFYTNPREQRLYKQLKKFIEETKEKQCHTKLKNKKMENTE